jgi:3-oxoacyl-[acyl-carrier protein] reductase
MDDLKDKVIIVTGASQGIGLAIANVVAKNNAKVILWDVVEEGIRSACEELLKQGKECTAQVVDVADEQSVKIAIEAVISKYGDIYGLVNNAGITRDNLILRLSSEQWDQVIKTNLTSMFYTCKYSIRSMLKRKEGSIVNISSVVGLMGNAGQVNYAASKAGVIGLTKSLAREVAAHNIRVNAIAPGFIMTKMTERLSDEVKNRFLQNIPMNRFGSCEEVANVVLFLLSSYSSYITGAVINVNGGLYM